MMKNEENDQQLQKNLCIEYLLLQRFSQMIYIKFNKVKQKIILKNNKLMSFILERAGRWIWECSFTVRRKRDFILIKDFFYSNGTCRVEIE